MRIIAIIPARYHSNRLPGKVLSEIAGQSILFRVYNQAVLTDVFDEIIVATDHQKVINHCKRLEIPVVMTSGDHISGTDRIAEVVSGIDADIVINIQGDEPFIEVECILAIVELLKNENVDIGTLHKKIREPSSIFDYHTVKLVTDNNHKVLYFSRQAIPAQRDKPYRKWQEEYPYYQHLGLYGFKRSTLLELVSLPPSALELSEKLEQLRWLENGYSIYSKKVFSDSFGIDTQEDLDKARANYK